MKILTGSALSRSLDLRWFVAASLLAIALEYYMPQLSEG
jgi:hypothetical protein